MFCVFDDHLIEYGAMNNRILEKRCNSCGLLKPLSAFLQLSESGAAVYGNMCSACRKANKDKASAHIDEGSATSNTGHSIDSKTKVKSDNDKLELREQIKEQDEKEREEIEIIRSQKIERRTQTAEGEKSHRETYLKRSFLDKTPSKNITPAESTYTAKEQAETKINFSAPVVDTQIAGKIKHHSSVFNSFKNWLPKGAAITANVKDILSQDNSPNRPGTKKK